MCAHMCALPCRRAFSLHCEDGGQTSYPTPFSNHNTHVLSECGVSLRADRGDKPPAVNPGAAALTVGWIFWPSFGVELLSHQWCRNVLFHSSWVFIGPEDNYLWFSRAFLKNLLNISALESVSIELFLGQQSRELEK